MRFSHGGGARVPACDGGTRLWSRTGMFEEVLMRDRDGLLALLRRIDGAPYPAYRDLVGTWDLGVVQLQFDRLQGDPFAAPSRVRLAVPTGIGIDISRNATRRRAAEDWLLRRFADGIKHARCGSG
ncbi:MAG: ABC-ATPase domain-containing protein, partial [Myxococcota bacterium]|nr:ABC-ATPase domain-containing protein [Myxococcota bacterium]